MSLLGWTLIQHDCALRRGEICADVRTGMKTRGEDGHVTGGLLRTAPPPEERREEEGSPRARGQHDPTNTLISAL